MIGKCFKLKKSEGFTLIEMIISISIFVLVFLIVINVYLIINNSQRKVVSLQKIQDDVRFLFESISQNIRLSQINYSFYRGQGISLHPNNNGSNNFILALLDQNQNEIFYRRSSLVAGANDGLGDKVQYCQVSGPNDCSLSDDSLWQNITPESVKVEGLRFIISPSDDPFLDTSSLSCLGVNPCSGECISYEWDSADGRCEYFSDGHNFQPKVRIVFKTVGIAATNASESSLVMQSIVGSRVIQNKVENLYYDD